MTEINSRMWLKAAVVAMLVPLAACSHGVGSSDVASGDGSTSTADRPPIHYDQVSVLTVDGQPQEQQTYQGMLDACQKAGMAAQPLSAGDTEKLGRVHVEAWIGPDRSARHQEEWHQDLTSPCHFTLEHKDETEIVDAKGRSTHIDGVTHQGDVQETGEPMPVEAVASDDGEMTDAARQAGWSKQGVDKVAGAECTIWQDPVGTRVCVWNGGGKWGFSANGVDALSDGTSHDSAIVLWSKPGKGSAWQLQTRTFTVGQALDPSAFKVPDNVSMQGEAP